jgi:hypothetical protein
MSTLRIGRNILLRRARLGWLLAGIASCVLLASCARSNSERSLDDATLLLIAAYQRMDDADSTARVGRSGLMAPGLSAPQANGTNRNEVEALIRIRQDLYADQLAKVDELYGGDQAARIKMSLEQEQQQKIESLLKAAERLKRSRARRDRGIVGFFRRIGRGIANVATRGLRTIGKVTRFVVTKLGPEVVRDMVMKRVQALNALIQGRFDLMWARVRSRLGGPLTTLLRQVVDQAFVYERDRLVAGLGLGRRAAAGDASDEQAEDEYEVGTSVGPEGEGGYDEEIACGDYAWIEAYFEGVQGELIAEGRNCRLAEAFAYRACLFDRTSEGACKDEALDACQSLYEAIPPNLPAGGATFTGKTIYGGAVRNEVTITISGSGGASGQLYYELYDSVMDCTIKATTTIEGRFDADTCTVNGTAQYESIYDGKICVSVCGIAPSSPAACPLTISGPTVWAAELEDDKLSGAIGDKSCDPHCFGFSATR